MTTLQRFGVPVDGGGRGNMLQPKAKHKFRVRVFSFGPIAGGIELTQQVVSVGRPKVSANAQTIHSYNSVAYYAGKPEWSPVDLVVRDDVTNSVSRLVGHQEQKQMNHLQQTSPLSGQNYKFTMNIETMTGDDTTVIERWILEGCFLENIDYDQFDYSSADAMMISMTVRFDNATQEGGLMPNNPEFTTGNLVG